jgi:hypothetical protein
VKAIGLLAILVVSILVACTPAALTPEEIVPAFIAASQADARTMRMEWQGTMAIAQSEVPEINPSMGSQSIDATFDFNGADFAGTMVTGLPGSSSSTSYARISGVAFINYAESGWQRAESFGGANVVPEMDPFDGLTAADVAYEAPDNLDGRQVHRLRVLDPLSALNGGLFAQAGEIDPAVIENGLSDFFIYVDASGIPVGAHVALDMSMNYIGPEMRDGAKVSYQIRFDYTFSLWGEPVTISPPEVTNGGFDDVPPLPGIK